VSSSASADAIVLGAGPAGAAAAFQLASAGRRVILLEQQQAPGLANPCGGGMAASVQRWFPFDLTPAVDQVIRRVRFTWALEDPVTAELPGDAPFWIVRRRVLDGFLSARAQEAGAELRCSATAEAVGREGGLWQVRLAGGETLRAPALVVAEGSGSRHATALGLGPQRPRYASTISVELDCPVAEPDTARFEFGLVHHGFCWAFPRQGGTSIGVGTFIGQQPADADVVLNALLPSLGLAADAGRRRQGRLRIWDGHHPLHRQGVVVAGDAASLCDPFLAEGLRPSLMSGCRAGEAVDRWLAGDGEALAGYSVRMRQDWGESMAWGKRIAQVFYRLPRVGYQLGIKRPTAPQRIAQILSGEMGYGDIAQRVIKRLLFQRG
jgi:geranylgeranyl reductase family protein